MFSRKGLWKIVGLVVLLALVAGCGPTPTPEVVEKVVKETVVVEKQVEVTKEVQVVVTATPEPEAAPEPVTLTLWKYASGMPTQKEWVDKWVKVYEEENPHITINYEEFPFAGYQAEVLPAAFASGDAPDVFWETPAGTRFFYESGVLLPLDDYLSEEYKNGLTSAALESAMYDGHIYSIPFEWDATSICYRTDIWEEMGLTEEDIPETWDELREVAKKLTTPEHYGLYLAPQATPHSVWMFTAFLWSAGGDAVNKDISEVLFDSPATVKALQLWGDMMNEDQSLVPAPLGIGEALGTGKAAMEFCAVAHIGVWKGSYPDMMEKWDLFPLPIPEGGTRVPVAGGFRLHVSAQSEHPEEAARFAVWLMAEDPERPLEWDTWARVSLSPWDAVAETQAYQDYFGQPPQSKFAEQAELARSANDWPPEILDAIVEAIQGVFFGGVSPEEAAKTAAEKMEAYIETR
jgi:multiple sugar transport system substrate-binding protein